MGLDEFKKEDDSSSSSSSSNNKIPASRPDESSNVRDDKFPIQGFDKTGEITPRSIKYQVESFGYKWKKQFSTHRVDTGELVMYSAGINTTHEEHTLMVFTTIFPLDVGHYNGDEMPIWVVPWNLEDMEPHSDGYKFYREDNWEKELTDTMKSLLGEVGRKFRENDW